MKAFAGRLGIIQRVLPSYRAPFFDMLAARCDGGLSVFAGQARPSESIVAADDLQTAKLFRTKNIHLFGGSLYLCWQLGVQEWLEHWKPDALIIEANPRYLSSRQAINWMKGQKRPIIAWGLGVTGPQRSLLGMRSAFRKTFLQAFDAVIAYSQAGADSYAAIGMPAEKVFVAPNAVAPAPKAGLPKRRIKVSGRARILFVGRLQARKALDRLFRACAALPHNLQPLIRLVGDGPHKAKLMELAKEIYPQVEFTGSLFDKDLEAEFQQADLFVLPGTGGLAIQQAMAFGLPIIAGQSDGSQADLVGPENGWQLASEDVSELASILEQALGDLDGLRKRGAASYHRVKEGYNLEAMSDVFIDVLRRISK